MSSENQPLKFSPSDFVALANQVFETAFGFVYLQGEIANFRVSKNKWVYFDLKDDTSKIACFGSVYSLPGPVEDGMLVEISGRATMHPQFGFSFTFQSIKPSGEGSIKKAFDMLRAKLQNEGLFDIARKRYLPYPPSKIALVTSAKSAAYVDFVKIVNVRWPYVEIVVYDTLVQGENAPAQPVNAINMANQDATADILVVTRGSGSADDMAAFSDERVVRALAASRIPTLVAIGHEIDESLAELVADKRASTPSNAAELIVPDKPTEKKFVDSAQNNITSGYKNFIESELSDNANIFKQISDMYRSHITNEQAALSNYGQILSSLNPTNVLKRGYSVIRLENGRLVRKIADVQIGNNLNITLSDGGNIVVEVKSIKRGEL